MEVSTSIARFALGQKAGIYREQGEWVVFQCARSPVVGTMLIKATGATVKDAWANHSQCFARAVDMYKAAPLW